MSDYEFDDTGRLIGLEHRRGADPEGGTLLAGYAWTFDRANRLTGMDFVPSIYDAEDVTFTYHARGQLTGADRTGTDEEYVYDANGNRITAGGPSAPVPSTTGPNNQLLFDGTYTYTYDAEGNRTSRTDVRSGAVTEYTWDHRNRLVGVSEEDRPAIDFDGYTLHGYTGQDGTPGNYETLEGGRTLHLWGNTWKAIAVNYTLTVDTLLELEFQSDAEGEWHAIALDSDLSGPQEGSFQLFGTQAAGQQAFHTYEAGDGWVHVRIPVGQFYTGTFPYLVLAADDDAATAVDVAYRNVRIYEEGQSSQQVTHTYDPLNQWITRTVDPDGETGSAAVEQTVFVHDGGQIVLQFEKTGSGDLQASDLSHRYLWGPAVDQLLADEAVESLTSPGEVLWPLGDHLNSVRDVVDSSGTLRKHVA